MCVYTGIRARDIKFLVLLEWPQTRSYPQHRDRNHKRTLCAAVGCG